MALPKLFQRIFWHNNTTPAINEDNLNAMSKAIDDIDNRVIALGDDVMTVVPQIAAYLEQAEDLVEAMELLSENPPYIGSNGNWWVWDTNTSAFVDSGVDASISVDIADITMLAPGAAPYVTNTGTDTDPIFHLFIPRGQTGNGISTIAKTGTSGLVDTYTITMTDGTTSTFTVTNGAGDMNKSVYDPTNAIANAGGMKSAATKDSTNTVTVNSTDLVESGAVYSADKGIYEVMGQNGAKSCLINNLVSGSVKDATLTVNNDKTFSFVGTTSGSGSLNICGENNGTEDVLGLPKGEYVLASDSTGLNINTFLQVIGKDGNGNVTINAIVNSDGKKYTSFTVNEGDFVYWVRLAFPSGAVNVSAKAMICLKSMYDFDPTYQPYAETNKQLTSKTDGLWDNMMDNGSVNLLDSAIATQVANDITVTNNGDGSYTVNCTSTSHYSQNFFSTKKVKLSKGTYKWTASKDGNSAIGSNNCYAFIRGVNGTVDWYRSYQFSHGYGIITLTQDSEIEFGITVGANVTVSNLTFYPMITRTFYYDDYVPYAKTNRELTEEVTDLDNMYDRKTPNVVADCNTPLIVGGSTFAINRFSSTSSNAPGGSGALLTWSSSANYGAQIAFNDQGLFYRKNDSGTIRTWQNLIS